MKIRLLLAAVTLCLTACHHSATGSLVTPDTRDPSIAHQWNVMLLSAISRDLARPTVHARNLWHTSAAMYDAWAAYDDIASTWLLGRSQNGHSCAFTRRYVVRNKPPARDRQVEREMAISFAAYRLIMHRFQHTPRFDEIAVDANALMATLGYDTAYTSTAYENGSPAALGNYIAGCYIAYGMDDGSNEANNYASRVYEPVNPPIEPEKHGNPDIVDLDRWQPIKLTVSIDQSGNVVSSTPPAVGPEWGGVDPFSLTDVDKAACPRAGFNFPIYHDPGPPPGIHSTPLEYKWTHELVAIWSSHLDPTQGRGAELVDISPASLGNIQSYPTNFAEHHDFYDLFNGDTTANRGYTVNPATGQPYTPQLVPLGDYARVLAEYWADGPNSVTPPGHWFVIANTISEHPDLVRRIGGTGPVLGPLEWDVKLYFAMGGAMHDAAITAWGIKGCYDSARPVSAIRGMAELGQSSDPMLPNYDPDGIDLVPGYIEVVGPTDPLADDPDVPGVDTLNAGKIKLYAWRGPDYVPNPRFDTAGVGWILAADWWPYQRPTFVTPPFPGYISGHSTYSRTGAELLTLFTGDAYFPGGKSEFHAPQNEFLVFEDGPSQDVVFEWAKYTDASDQCSLSRIWGGIHPPADDIVGRRIGMALGPEVYEYASGFYRGQR
jgi:Domain of unknown function (DUF6851)